MRHLYENGERSVYAWNAVDVEVDGLLQHGHVIDIQDADGREPQLIVNFGSPAHESVLVKYGKVFDCSSRSADERSTYGRPSQNVQRPKKRQHTGNGTLLDCFMLDCAPAVQALLCERSDQPWRWFPAKLLLVRVEALKNFALVDITLAGQPIRELLPYSQIRQPPSAEDLRRRRLQPGDFFITLNSLDDRYLTAEPSRIALPSRQEGQQECRLVAYLRYKKRRRGMPALNDKSVYCDAGLDNLNQDFQDDFDCGMYTDREHGLFLPVVLLMEVFQSLDVIYRQRCRRTCRLWEDILSSPQLLQVFCVALPMPGSPSTADYRMDTYVTCNCIVKQITPAVRAVCLRDHRYDHRDFEGLFDSLTPAGQAIKFTQQILESSDFHIQRLVLHQHTTPMLNQEYNLEEYLDDLAQLYSGLESCCDCIVWKDCQLLLTEDISFKFPIVVIRLDTVNAELLWDLFEGHLDCGDLSGLDSAVQWTAKNVNIKSQDGCCRLLKILQAFKFGDPRSSVYGAARSWLVDNNVGISSSEVKELRKICLDKLWRYIMGDTYDTDTSEDSEDSLHSGKLSLEGHVSSGSEETSEDEPRPMLR
ncbi:uncharacterized protein LOC129599020 [Paramacrobiotus metropolitanus]|uniref:uncharacterized protein LOC129599020 n=1 Tax=Paramacrobiotus metropolitanus TaxID=2943436 RepID=UPI0024457FC6|nr:uncharacterized protein LOC129599020 [Paramacrobiotus metropolitanus]